MADPPKFPPRQPIPGKTAAVPESFIAACLAGRAKPEDAPAYIERWQATVVDGSPLSRFLGMTDAEWGLYLEAEGNLAKILAARTVKRYPAEKARPRRFGSSNGP
jgi:hypothetical protein